MDELTLLKEKVDLMTRENSLLNEKIGMEFERISKAFSQLGNLLDLLYLETSVLIEMLAKKEVISQEEFTKTLEETAKKVEEQIKAAADANQPKEKPIIETL
jgi:hypothetical protein